MSDFNVGDLVEARKGECIIRDRVQVSERWPDSLFLGDSPYAEILNWYTVHGFTLSLVEAATPPLPTEPGVYLDKWRDTWQLSEETSAFAERWFLGSDFMTHNVARGYAPFTKLEPVPDTAKKVIDLLETVGADLGNQPRYTVGYGLADLLREEFGVTS